MTVSQKYNCGKETEKLLEVYQDVTLKQ